MKALSDQDRRQSTDSITSYEAKHTGSMGGSDRSPKIGFSNTSKLHKRILRKSAMENQNREENSKQDSSVQSYDGSGEAIHSFVTNRVPLNKSNSVSVATLKF